MTHREAPKQVPLGGTRTARTGTSLRDASFYGALAASLLVGLMAYNAGASLEGALMRIIVTLLACTAVGFALNIVLMLAENGASLAAEEPAAREADTSGLGRVNLSVGDEAP